MTVTDIIKWFESLKTQRANWESHWREVGYYCLPAKGNISSDLTLIQGGKLPSDVYDSTAIHSVQVFAAGLHAYLTNPATLWFEFDVEDEALRRSQEVQQWLYTASREVYRVLNASNFNQQIFEHYLDLITFGTATIYAEEDENDIVRFYSRPVQEIYIVENVRGTIDTVFRSFKMTARQAYEEWGKDCGEKVLKAIEGNKFDESFDFLQVVMPREVVEAEKKDALNMPYASYYIEPLGKHLISEGGYSEFPFFVARFTKRSGESYGYSAAMVSLPDIKMVNNMTKTMLKTAQKMNDPPLQVPDDGYVLPINTSPSGINYYRAGTQGKVEPLYPPNLHNLPITLEMVRRFQESIKDALYVSLFLMLAGHVRMTATEVMKRLEEKMLILSPILGRLTKELLQPLLIRTLNILIRKDKIKVLEGLEGQDYTIKYISPLARAQKVIEMRAVNDFVLTTAQIAQLNPESLDAIDFDRIIKEAVQIYDVPPEILRDDIDVATLRNERKEQLETMAILQQAKTGGRAIRDIAQAEKIAQEIPPEPEEGVY